MPNGNLALALDVGEVARGVLDDGGVALEEVGRELRPVRHALGRRRLADGEPGARTESASIALG
jgi:hypothetical protein